MGDGIDLRTWHPGAEWPEGEEDSGQRTRQVPLTDVFETSNQFVLEVEFPGVARGDIELTVTRGRVVLEGVRAARGVEGRLLVAERQMGVLEREFTLPGELGDEPQADHRDGVLTIRFPGRRQVQGGELGRPMAPAVRPWPPIDVLETGDGLTLLVDLPGFPQDAIDVLFEEQKLTLRGRRVLDATGRHYHLAERQVGGFSRTVLLPEQVDGERIQASFKDGVLSVALPASGAPARPRKRGLLGRKNAPEQAASAPPSEAAGDPPPSLREELEALRAQHQALRSELDGFWLALGCGLRLAQVPLHQHLPVEVSLSDEDPSVRQRMREAVRGFVEFAGFELWRELPVEDEAFLARWQVRTRRKENQLELQQRLLRVQEALELARGGAMQAREPVPEDFQDAERQRLLGEVARPWAEAVFTLTQALRAAGAGASVLIGGLCLRKQEPVGEGTGVVLQTLNEEELAARLRSWSAAP